ncbi:MAG: hypothetical protein M1830_005388 [Pleopsidium flavum]|nr:MAG: hypothetical protein M1830_005388 [Pleopsidium flavum]
MAPNNPNKRKQPSHPISTAHAQKRRKTQDARNIAAQTNDKALKNGELDVSAFVKAREYEIKALELSMGKAKKALSTRAFQSVPRNMRRRTASHNVKKVPKRLRTRASKEMAEDHTPSVTARRRKPTPHMRLRLETAKRLEVLSKRAKAKKNAAKFVGPDETDPTKMVEIATRLPKLKKNTLLAPPKPAPKFRKRQVRKTWLPTHLYHAKRAHMTLPTEPLWRFAIPLTPTEKSYRPTHRASAIRGCVAWDTSYMATIGLEGVELSLQGLLKAVGVEAEVLQGNRGRKWKKGTRSWEGWTFERDGDHRAITPVTVVWRAEEKVDDLNGTDPSKKQGLKKGKPKKRVIVRLHPAAFLQLWDEFIKVAKMQRPPVMVEDLRFEIGSIEIIGPGSTEALLGALKPVLINNKGSHPAGSPESTWIQLANLTNPAALPANALLGFDSADPRLHHPPRNVIKSSSLIAADELLELLADWPPDSTQTSPSLFDRTARLTASRCLPSQKAINRRKGAAPPGAYPDPLPDDPKIPILLLASRPEAKGSQGSWTLLLAWKCVLPVWYSLMHYPLSSGGNPRFGGLRETRQIAFEQGVPWFPGDYPGTKAGWDWECMEREKRKSEWEKRPKGKRVEWESVNLGKGRTGEVGLGWACDWTRLIIGPSKRLAQSEAGAETVNTQQASLTKKKSAEEPSSSSTPTVATNDASLSPPGIYHLPSTLTSPILNHSPTTLPEQFRTLDLTKALTTIKITLLSRGTPTSCARIYRLPTKNPNLRAQWLSLATPIKNPKHAKQNLPKFPTLPKDAPAHLRRQHLATSLLAPDPLPTRRKSGNDIIPQAGDEDYPVVPDEEDLIGFVTTGNFNLGEGKGTGMGCLVLGKVLEGRGRERALCVVREAGVALGRLGRWEIV